MPRCLTGVPIPIVLDSDQALPEGQRPTFLFRAPSGKEWLAITARLDAATAGGKTSDRMAAIYAVLTPHLVGWENMVDHNTSPPSAVPFAQGSLNLVVDPNEAAELFSKLQLSLDDKKKSESQPSSGQG